MTDTARGRPLSGIMPDCGAPAAEVVVHGIAYDSRRVRPGDLFFAFKGLRADGADYVADAVARGAAAVVAERDVRCDVPVVVVDNARRAMAEASHRFHDHPDRAIKLIGVIGTNGKSTVAAGLHRILMHAGMPAGLIGTLECTWPGASIKSERTTPEAPDIDAMLARMREGSVTHAAMEASSHAVALDRVWGLTFAGLVFTNLTRDHLDYHASMDAYKAAKRALFERLNDSNQFAVINGGDPVADEFAAASEPARVMRFSRTWHDGDVTISIDSHTLDGTSGRLSFGEDEMMFQSPLCGEFNHSNIAAMAAAAWGAGLAPNVIAGGISRFGGVPGRLEFIHSGAPFWVCIDFAHTPDAFTSVLSTLRPMVGGRLNVLFGCGGDRDRGKRPLMAKAVAQWADQVYLTSDNPRSEDPDAIIAEVRAGFDPDFSVWVQADRARAIAHAIDDAQPGDLVLLCGKGHETSQEIAGTMHPFSDRQVAAEALAAAGHPLPKAP